MLPDGAAIADAKPLVSALAPGSKTAYLSVPAGTYTLAVAAAGTTTGAYTSDSMTLTGGQAKTALIVDQKLLNTPSTNVLIANDSN